VRQVSGQIKTQEMLDLESEPVILSTHGIFVIFRNDSNDFLISTMASMLVLLHPRHVFIMVRSNNVYTRVPLQVLIHPNPLLRPLSAYI
jgi:hypothetical protein